MTNISTPAPLGLSKRQQDALNAILDCEGNAKRAAERLGVTKSTFEARLHAARKRMQAPTRLWLFVLWDRMRRAA
jgi:predicted DNA-binding protein (UPF0251 family)